MATKVEAWKSLDGIFYGTESEAVQADKEYLVRNFTQKHKLCSYAGDDGDDIVQIILNNSTELLEILSLTL